IGDAAKKVVSDLRPGQVCLLENLRFHAEEEKNESGFVSELASLCDVYVNDAFGSSHRAHASVDGIPRVVHEMGMGDLLRYVVTALASVNDNPEKPFVAVLGGAKVSDKIKVIESLIGKCQAICIGGAMANTLLAAGGADLKSSKLENEHLALGRSLIQKARD